MLSELSGSYIFLAPMKSRSSFSCYLLIYTINDVISLLFAPHTMALVISFTGLLTYTITIVI